MRPIVILCLGCIWTVPAHGAFEHCITDAWSAGRGGATIASLQCNGGPFSNPAGLASCEHIALHTSYSHPFGLETLHLATASSAIRTRIGGTGFGAMSFGESLYRETTLHAGWGARLFESVAVGARLRLAQLEIRNYGAANAFMFDLGILYALSAVLRFGMSAFNLNQARLGEYKDPLPQVTQWGASFEPHPSMQVGLDLIKDVRFPLEIRAGLAYRPLPALALRSGFSQMPSSFSMGIGIRLFRSGLDYACTRHPVLGDTHQASLSIQLTH